MRYSGYDYWRSTFIAVLVSITMIGALSCGDGEDQPGDGQQELEAPEITPTFIAGNPTCGSLGFGDFEYKIDPVHSGTYSIGGINDITITVQSTSNGQVFDWSSDLPIDAIVVKGGPNANLYDFTPNEYDSGTAYHSPVNPNNGRYYGLSHISFCYDYNVIASKTADTSLTRTYEWDIDKTVSPETWDLFSGDTGTSDYEVTVEKLGFTDSAWKVVGNIYVENPSPSTATITDVEDMLSNAVEPTVDCGVSFPHSLPAGQTLTCSYMHTFSVDPTGMSLTNTVEVSTSGTIDGDEATVPVDFGAATINSVNDTININDTNGKSWMASDTATFSYSRAFACNEDEGEYTNIASIVETGQSADATVTVDCYDLDVQKTASGLQLQSFGWDILKYVSDVSLGSVGPEGGISTLEIYLDEFGMGTGSVEYQVVLTLNTLSETFSASGEITVTNPNPNRDARVNNVTDLVEGGFSASVDCGGSTPYIIPMGQSLVCTYTTILPDALQRTNTATAELQNYDYASDGTGTMSGTTDWSGTAEIIFSAPQGAPPVGVIDSLSGPFLGTFSEGVDLAPYSLEFDQDDCGEIVNNIASFAFGAEGSDDADVEIVCIEPPDEGCTPGYWKNHPGSWGATGYSPTDKLNSVFPSADLYGLGDDTLMMALRYRGGPSTADKASIMLRAAVAALLNASSPDVDYAYTTLEVINKVEAALQSGSKGQILSLASDLDFENNSGCPLN